MASWRQRVQQAGREGFGVLGRARLGRAEAPDGAGPARVSLVAGNDVHMQLSDDISERAGVDLGAACDLLQRLRDQIGQHVWPVHRLDQGTCGLLVFALNKESCQQLARAFAEQRVQKTYLALVRGWLPQQVEVDYALRPEDSAPDAPPQSAQTTLRCLAMLDWPQSYDPRHPSTRASLVLAQPHTGRRHQIRRHLKHVAHPILGDATHGKGPLNRWWAQRLGGQRLWLHAHALQLRHPRTGEALALTADWHALPQVPEVQQWQHMLQLPGWQTVAPWPGSCSVI